MDPKQTHIEQREDGRWVILNPDWSSFDHRSYASRGAARRAQLAYARE